MGFGYGRTTSHSATARDRESGEVVSGTFTNDMVAHVWAQRSQTFGKSNNGNFYFEGDALYSYGSHFLVAYLLDTGGEVVALHNSDTYGVTTSGHQSDGRGAARHYTQFSVPELTELREALPVLAEYAGKPGKLKRAAKSPDNWREARAVRDVRAWLGKFDIEPDSEVTSRDGSYTWTRDGNDSGAYMIAKAAGISRAEVAKIQRERAKAIAKRKAAEEKRETESQLRDAKAIAGKSDSDFRAEWPEDGRKTWETGDGSKPWELEESLRLATRLYRAAKAAKARGWTRIAAEVRAKERDLREHIKGRNARIIADNRRRVAAEVRAWRNGDGKRPNSYRFDSFPAIKRAIERAERAEHAERNARLFAEWQAGEGARPSLSNYEPDSIEWGAVAESIREERANFAERAEQWLSDESASVAAMPSLASGAKYADLPEDAGAETWRTLEARLRDEKSKRENRELWERQRAMRAAWLAGERNGWHGSDETGGALMRVAGDMLETSQGASVPLAHAVKAFRFIKACRESGKSWQRNGQTIRVGHFQVDSIDSAGNFRAGCHSFNWPEVERVAKLAGVFDAAPSAEAIETKAHA